MFSQSKKGPSTSADSPHSHIPNINFTTTSEKFHLISTRNSSYTLISLTSAFANPSVSLFSLTTCSKIPIASFVSSFPCSSSSFNLVFLTSIIFPFWSIWVVNSAFFAWTLLCWFFHPYKSFLTTNIPSPYSYLEISYQKMFTDCKSFVMLFQMYPTDMPVFHIKSDAYLP